MRKSLEILTREVFTFVWNLQSLEKEFRKKKKSPTLEGSSILRNLQSLEKRVRNQSSLTLEVIHSYGICNQLRKESGRNFSPSVFTRMESEDVIPSPFSENDFSFSKNAADATFIFSFSYN
jgi:hypothetical protein